MRWIEDYCLTERNHYVVGYDVAKAIEVIYCSTYITMYITGLYRIL